MVTRIPPMITVEPQTYDPNCTVLESSWNESDAQKTQQVTSTQPILYFSYEGEVAVQGNVSKTPGSRVPNHMDHGDQATGDIIS